jgi:hypothetical protein
MFGLIAAGLSGLSAYGSASVASAEAKANNRISAAQSHNDNRVRGAGNAFNAARGSLQRYMQSLQNNQTLEAGGEAMEANLINARRTEDVLTEASFEEQIRSAEQTGTQAAAAAFAGVGGEVADTVSISTRLMQQRSAADALRSQGFRTYDTARRAAAIQAQTIRSLDNSVINDSLDYSISVAQKRAAPSVWGSTALAVGSSLLSNNGAGLREAGSLFRSAVSAFTPKNEWGTGAAYGNDDIGRYI